MASQNAGSGSSTSLGSLFDSDDEENGTCSMPRIGDTEELDSFSKKSSYLLGKMRFSKREVDSAFSELGEGASLDLLVDWIVSAQEMKIENCDEGDAAGAPRGSAMDLQQLDPTHAIVKGQRALRPIQSRKMVKIEHCDEGDAASAGASAPRGGAMDPQQLDSTLAIVKAEEELDSFSETRSYLLSKMSFSKKEVDLAISELGEGASLDQLVNWIMTAQEASNEGNAESLPGLMNKPISLLQMGFTQQEVSFAIQAFGEEATIEELADSIFAKRFANTTEQNQVKRTRPVYSRSGKTDKDDNFAPMGKRGRPTRAKSAKNKTWRNPEFVYGDDINISSNSESESKGKKDVDYNLTKKRGRPARAKSAKSNMWRKPEFVYGDNLDISTSRSETEGNKDDDYNPTVPDADGHPKKYARSRGRPTHARSAKSKTWHKPEFVSRDNINISSSSGSKMERNKDDDYDPPATDVDIHRQKYASFEDTRGSAFERASEVKEKLSGKEASFVKLMLPSHVDRVFWLGLPRKYCKKHLPEKDSVMTLEDEEGQIFHTKYLVARDGLSGGWKSFAEKHRLKVGDALVFRLMSSDNFKVYIVRENELTTTDVDVNSKQYDDVSCNEEDGEVTIRVGSATANDDSKNNREANDDGSPSLEKMRALASKMAIVKDALKTMNEEAEELESTTKKTVQAFQRLATTSW